MKKGLLSKKVLIALGVIALVVVGLLFQSQVSQVRTDLELVSTNPTQNSTHNPFLPVILIFNRPPKSNEFQLTIVPQTSVTTVASGSAIRLVPAPTFQENTNYTITIITKQKYILTFTTEQAASNAPGWNKVFDQSMQEYQTKYGAQDKALETIRKNSPVKQPGFTIAYSYDTNTYTVTLLAPYDQNKAAFLRWFQSLGVNDTSILPLEYLNK
jgi:hypothetical protein